MLAGLARALVQHQVLRPDQAVAIQKRADSVKTRFIDELIAGGPVTASQLAPSTDQTMQATNSNAHELVPEPTHICSPHRRNLAAFPAMLERTSACVVSSAGSCK